MASLAPPPSASERLARLRSGQQPGEWGLLLIAVLLCVGMILFALAAQAVPAASEVPGSHSCISTSEPRPERSLLRPRPDADPACQSAN